MADQLDKLNALSAPLGQGQKASEILTTTPPAGLARQGTTASQDLEALSATDSPTPGNKLYEIGVGTAQGAARDSPVAYGGMAGFRLGMPMATAAAPFIGPWAGAIPVVTTAAGMGAGYLFGQELDKFFPAVSREDLIPYREGGITFGSSIAAAPVAFGLPEMTGSRVSRFISAIGTSARANPKLFLTTEGLGAASAGIAGGTAVAYAPDSPGTRLTAEIGGGMFAPGRLLLNATTTAGSVLSNLRSAMTQSGRESRAANRLYSILEENGTDIPRLIKALEAPLPGGVATPTAAQKTGNLGLTELENALGRHHARFAGESSEQGRQALRAYQLLIDRLKDVGDPAALRQAAQMRETMFNGMLDGRLAAADADAALKIGRITKDTPSARRQIGDIVKVETEIALRQARDYESELWNSAIEGMTKPVSSVRVNKVDMEGPEAQRIFDRTGKWPQISIKQPVLKAPVVKPSATADVFLNRAANVGEALFEDAIPAPVRKIMESLRVDKDAVQRFKAGKVTEEYLETKKVPYGYKPNVSEIGVDELVNYRSTLLKMARESAGRGEMGNADFYGALAEGMLKDLSDIKNPMFDNARQFSKSLNDVFTRTFAKTASITGDVTKAGAERLPAEILVQRAFGANADVTAQRMEEIEGAVKFMRNQYDDAVNRFGKRSAQAQALKPMAELADKQIVSVQDAQERVLRLAANKTVDPTTGRLNAKSLTKFVAENKTMLDKMGITSDLDNAITAENALRTVIEQNSAMNKTIRGQTAFNQVLRFESPTAAINDALNSKFPVKSIGNMTKLASAGGPDAVNGLKSSLYDYAYTKAGGNTKFNAQAFDEALFKPLAPNQPSLVNIMRANGLMTLTEVKNLRSLINPMLRVEDAMTNGRTLDTVVEGADAVTDLAMRILGSKIGTTASGGGPNSLIAASAGSKAIRQIFDKMPTISTRNVIEQAAKDPQFMALLLQRGRTEADKIRIARSLHAYMGAAGLNYANFEEPPAPAPLSMSMPGNNLAATQLRQLPSAPSTRGVPGFGKAPGPAKPGPTPGAAPAGGDSRSMFQSLFPFDTISPMVGGQQPPKQ
jgi:hypothetical protein